MGDKVDERVQATGSSERLSKDRQGAPRPPPAVGTGTPPGHGPPSWVCRQDCLALSFRMDDEQSEHVFARFLSCLKSTTINITAASAQTGAAWLQRGAAEKEQTSRRSSEASSPEKDSKPWLTRHCFLPIASPPVGCSLREGRCLEGGLPLPPGAPPPAQADKTKTSC